MDKTYSAVTIDCKFLELNSQVSEVGVHAKEESRQEQQEITETEYLKRLSYSVSGWLWGIWFVSRHLPLYDLLVVKVCCSHQDIDLLLE